MFILNNLSYWVSCSLIYYFIIALHDIIINPFCDLHGFLKMDKPQSIVSHILTNFIVFSGFLVPNRLDLIYFSLKVIPWRLRLDLTCH